MRRAAGATCWGTGRGSATNTGPGSSFLRRSPGQGETLVQSLDQQQHLHPAPGLWAAGTTSRGGSPHLRGPHVYRGSPVTHWVPSPPASLLPTHSPNGLLRSSCWELPTLWQEELPERHLWTEPSAARPLGIEHQLLAAPQGAGKTPWPRWGSPKAQRKALASQP